MRFIILTFVIMSGLANHLQADVVLSWGVLNINLVKSGSDNYTGSLDITFSQAINMGKIPFELYKDNQAISQLKERHLYLRKNNSASSVELKFLDNSNKISESEFAVFRSKIAVRDVLVCFLTSEAGENYTVVMTVHSDQPNYYPPLSVVPFSKMTHFKYQLVTRLDGSQVLKMDTTIAANSAIKEAYKKIPKVKIYHLPKYETSVNFLSESDSMITVGKRNFNLHPVNTPKDDYLITAVEPKEITESIQLFMDWNKMIAKPDSPVFAMEYLKSIRNNSINFFDGAKKYEILSMRFTLLDGKKLNKSYYWNSSETYPIQELSEMVDPFSVLLDRVILKDAKYGTIYIPQAFIFNFQ